ncbi:MAG: branched-chain amino acid ABC transporter permease [Erysipelotrichaceae bacterium]
MFNKKNLGWLIITLAIYSLVKVLLITGVINPFYEISLITIMINIVLALGLNLIIGYSGQFSLGHAGFMAIGAYTTAIVMIKVPSFWGFVIGMLLGMLLCGVISLMVAIPTLRLRGDYLAIATLGASEIIRILIINMKITNGASGISGITKYVNFDVAFVLLMFCLIVILNFIRSNSGRCALAIKEDEIASQAMGINTTKFKVIAFLIGTIFAAMAGSMYASYFFVIYPNSFGFVKSVDILIIVVFGGIGSISGTILSAVVLGIMNIFLQNFVQLRMIIYALLLIVIMVFKPSGLLGTKELTMDKIFKFFGGRKYGNTKGE